MERPSVIFADEPTGNLDSRSSREVLGFLRQCVQDYGQSIVMVTHDPRAASFADRVLVLSDGSITQDMDHPTYDDILAVFAEHDDPDNGPVDVEPAAREPEPTMFRIGLRDTKAHFRRFIMSIIAIALGVAFVVGSFCFREMLNDQVSQMMGSNSDADVYVRGATEEKQEPGGSVTSYNSTYNEISTSIIPDIENVDGRRERRCDDAAGQRVLLDHNGDALTTVGAPTLVIGVDQDAPCVRRISSRANTRRRTMSRAA